MWICILGQSSLMIWYHRGSEGQRKAYLILEKIHHGVEGVWRDLDLEVGRVGTQCSLGVSESCSVLSDSLQPHGLHSAWNSPGQNTGVGSLSLLQGIFPTQGLNPGPPHCRRILYQLSLNGGLLVLRSLGP